MVWLRSVTVIAIAITCEAEGSNSTSRILFGSCNSAFLPQPLWPVVLSRRPDVWIWGGDNIYADIPPQPFKTLRFTRANPDRLRKVYAIQMSVPGYQQLLSSPTQLVGTWDDHDFGLNDGDSRYPYRSESQTFLLDFLGELPESRRRGQHGVYAAQHFEFLGGSVLVLLLDMRFHKDPYGTPHGDFLGEEQWSWLEQTLSQSTADVHLIVSSLQFLEPRQRLGENWGRFPGARARLLELLAVHRVATPILLTGDVHFAELSMGTCQGGRLLEVTSSGMTHSWGTRDAGQNSAFLRLAMPALMSLAQSVMPWRYQMREPSRGSPLYYLGLNFGELEINWAKRGVTVRIFGADGRPHLEQSFEFGDLGVGSAGAAGVRDLVPERGHPEFWRVALGISILFGTPISAIAGLLTVCCMGTCRAAHAVRRFHAGRMLVNHRLREGWSPPDIVRQGPSGLRDSSISIEELGIGTT